MAVTISVALQKGGVSKSTTAETISSILGNKGKRVLLVDLDSQANVSFISGAEITKTITDVFSGEIETQEALYHCKRYDLLPADDYLANLDHNKVKHTLLISVLEPIQKDYDYIVIDTGPSLGNLLMNALMASNYVLIPIDSRPLSINGLDALQETIHAVQAVNKTLKILGIVLVKYNPRAVLNRAMKEVLEGRVKDMGTILFNTAIREGIAVPEAQALKKSLIDYAPKSKPYLDYEALVEEMLDKMRG